MHDVSFIIVNYNTFDLTCQCIESILIHQHGIVPEIIVVDNNSKECNPDKFKISYPDIILVKSADNKGFANGNNQGIKIATGKYICLINSDARLKQVNWSFLKEKASAENIGFVTGKLIFPDGQIQHNCQHFPSALITSLEKLRLQKLLPRKIRSRIFQGFYFDYDNPGTPDWVWGAFMFFERELLKIYDGHQLSEDFFMYVEDMQWCYLANKSGFKTFYDPKTLVVHEMGQSRGTKNSHLLQNMRKFREMYSRKSAKAWNKKKESVTQ